MPSKTNPIELLIAPLALAAAALPVSAQVSGTTTRVSISSTGEEADNASITNSNTPLSISSNGRIVAFNSRASNLVPGDTNGIPDVFVRDLVLGTTERVSISSTGQQANGDAYGRGSYGTALSADGRYVAFYSYSPNLVSGDTGGYADVFVHDRVTGTTERVSVSTANQSPNSVSQCPSISADGRYVAFESSATNLVSGDKNKTYDIFVRDRVARSTRRTSVSSTGKEGNGVSAMTLGGTAISDDGRYVVFSSAATNLVAGDTNGQYDVFVRDTWSNTTQRVSLTSAGGQTNGFSGRSCISGDGRFVAFYSTAANLAPPGAQVSQNYVHDRVLHTTTCASVSSSGQPADRSVPFHSAFSADGRYLVFSTSATNLVAGATSNGYNVFLRDLVFGTTTCPTAWAGGWPFNGTGGNVAIDALGLTIAFDSLATNLVPGDTNGVQDVFVVQ